MASITQELERTAHDIAQAPSIRDNIEIAITGGILGAALGYFRGGWGEAKSYAKWGAGLGIAGQYMLYHMLKPAMHGFSRSAHSAAIYGGNRALVGAPFMHGGLMHGLHPWRQQPQQIPQMPMQQPPCPPGFVMNPVSGQCAPMPTYAAGWDLFHDVFGTKDPFHGHHEEHEWQRHHDMHEHREHEHEHREFEREHEHEHPEHWRR